MTTHIHYNISKPFVGWMAIMNTLFTKKFIMGRKMPDLCNIFSYIQNITINFVLYSCAYNYMYHFPIAREWTAIFKFTKLSDILINGWLMYANKCLQQLIEQRTGLLASGTACAHVIELCA